MKPKEIRKFRESYTKYDKDCVFEGYKLAVHFDEKDSVKKLGGRWDADEQTWWMPEKNLKNDAHPNGSLVVDVLNDNEMIMGQYGKYKGPCQGEGVEYKLRQPGQAGTRYTVNFWIESDAVAFHQSLPDGTFGNNCPDVVWQTVEEARIHWDELIAEGYIRVENS